MQLKSIFLALAVSAACMTGFMNTANAATDLGALSEKPLLVTSTATPKVTFDAKYLFSLTEDAFVSAEATNWAWSFGGKNLLDISDFTLKLFDGADNLITTGMPVGNSRDIVSYALPAADKYYFELTGMTSGDFGGSYSLTAFIDSASTAPVPEPGTLPLLGGGLAAIGFMRARSQSKNR